MNLSRSKTLITWGTLYLAASWLIVVSGALNPDTEIFKATDLLALLSVPAGIVAFIFNWRWLRSIVISSRSIDVGAIEYRQGWAFWGWVTPFAAWWVPARLIERSHAVFVSELGESETLKINPWWGLWIATSVVDYLSARAGWVGINPIALDFISAVLLSIAFPYWKTMVETLTAAQSRAAEKVGFSIN